MAFSDYSGTPAANTTLGDDIFIGPNMERGKVRPALQQLAADGRELYDEMIARNGGSDLPNFIQSGAGAVARTMQEKGRDIVDLRDFGIPADNTDQTAAIVSKLTGLGADWEGTVQLPLGMRADIQQVMAALPENSFLKFDIVFQEGTGYRQQMTGIADYPPDANTDTAFTIISRQYADVHLNNIGNPATESGIARRVGISYGRGFFRVGRLGPRMQWQTNWERSPVRTAEYGGLGVSCYKVVTRAPERAGDYEEWVLNMVTEVGRYYVVDAGRFYKALTSAISTVKPTFTSGTQTVGGVQWEFVSEWIGFRTCFYIDELGRIGSNAVDTGTTQLWEQNPEDAEDFNVRYVANGLTKRITFRTTFADYTVEPTTTTALPYVEHTLAGGVRWLSSASTFVMCSFTDAAGFSLGVHSQSDYTATDGDTTPAANGGSRCILANSGATSITNFDTFVARQKLTLYFTNGNTTLVHSGLLQLKGAINVNPAGGTFLTIERDPTNVAWLESSRSF